MPSIRKLKSGAFQATIRFRGVQQYKSFPTKKQANAWGKTLERNIKDIGALSDDQIEKLSNHEIDALGGRELFAKLNCDVYAIQNRKKLEQITRLSKGDLLRLEPQEIENLGGVEAFEHVGKAERIRYKTFSSVCDAYLAQWTKKDYHGQALRVSYWCDVFGQQIINDIDIFDIREHIDTLLAAGKRTATISRNKAVLSSIFKFAQSRGYINENIVANVVVVSDSKPRDRVLTPDERSDLLSACEQSSWPRLKLLVLMALTTGARRGELLGLRWNDIDFKNRSTLLTDTKNGSSRQLNFPSIVIDELRRFQEIGNGLLFASDRKSNQAKDIRKCWAAALRTAGISATGDDKFTFHCLRHGFCSALSDQGLELSEIAEQAGHRSIQTTMRYIHQSSSRKQEIVDGLADAFGLGG